MTNPSPSPLASLEQQESLSRLWQRGTQFLGCTYSILGGAMTWVSDADLVSAISNAGGFGILASGAMPPEALERLIRQTRTQTSRPFGVNLILLHPQLDDLLQVCIQEKISHVILAGGIPNKAQIQILHDHQIRVVGFAPALSLAKRLIKAGIDALIIEGSEAGGHVGPVSTSVLSQEILPHVGSQVPVFVAGGIGRGEMILSYLKMGASGCQLGTRFVCATECNAHPDFKQAFVKASAKDSILSPQLDARFPVIPVRALSNGGMRNFLTKQRDVLTKFEAGDISQKEGQMEIEHFWAGALRRAVVEGDIANGSLMAGQSVGMVTAIEPVADIIHTLLAEIFQAMPPHVQSS